MVSGCTKRPNQGHKSGLYSPPHFASLQGRTVRDGRFFTSEVKTPSASIMPTTLSLSLLRSSGMKRPRPNDRLIRNSVERAYHHTPPPSSPLSCPQWNDIASLSRSCHRSALHKIHPFGFAVSRNWLTCIRLTSNSVRLSYCSFTCNASGSFGLSRCNTNRSPSRKRESLEPQHKRIAPFS